MSRAPAILGKNKVTSRTGCSAGGQAADGWQRHLGPHDQAVQPALPPLPPAAPQPLTRKVERHGCVMLKYYRYYIGIAWAGETLPSSAPGIHGRSACPMARRKPYLVSICIPSREPKSSSWPPTPGTAPRAAETNLLTRRTNQNAQIAFHNRLYFVGSAPKGQTLAVVPTAAGLEVYNTQQAWISTCPWRQPHQPDKPPYPM